MRLKRSEATIKHVSYINLDSLVEAVVDDASFEDIHDFIVKLDKACEDWGVTEKLFKYFETEMKKCPEDEE